MSVLIFAYHSQLSALCHFLKWKCSEISVQRPLQFVVWVVAKTLFFSEEKLPTYTFPNFLENEIFYLVRICKRTPSRERGIKTLLLSYGWRAGDKVFPSRV